MHMNRVKSEFIQKLEVGESNIFRLNDDELFNVELIDANHCPGAVMFLFTGYVPTCASHRAGRESELSNPKRIWLK
jgi:hypothetical protein